MQRKETIYVCDNCGAEKTPQENTKIENPLPLTWVRMAMTENTDYESVDLCQDCKWAVWKALEQRRTSGA